MDPGIPCRPGKIVRPRDRAWFICGSSLVAANRSIDFSSGCFSGSWPWKRDCAAARAFAFTLVVPESCSDGCSDDGTEDLENPRENLEQVMPSNPCITVRRPAWLLAETKIVRY